jgi:AcrR family transcriptional regulator
MARPKQDRAVRTREAILRAAARVFEEYGFAGASISKIMAQAGTTQGAMYFHFKSKEDLARAVMNEQAADLQLPEYPGGLRQLLEVTFYIARQLQASGLLRAGVTLAVEQGQFGLRDFTPYQLWAEQFRDELVAAQVREELLPGVDVAEVAQLLVAAYTGSQIMSNLRTGSGRVDLPQRIARMWRYLLPGIAARETLEPLQRLVDELGAEA